MPSIRVCALACVIGLLSLTVLAAQGARAEAPYSFETTFGRLPKDVVPESYELSLTPDIATLTVQGDETVQLQVRKQTTRIQFNSLRQSLREVTVDGMPVAKVDSSDTEQLTTLTLARPLAPGPHVLHFKFTGRINEQSPGLYLQKYTDAQGKDTQMLATQLESIYARQMFPCWDEPAFRARFALSVSVPREWVAVSNMRAVSRQVDGALATTRFAPTPSMPSYLLALAVGDLASISARAGDTELGIWAARGRESQGAYALANAQVILADFNEYFGFPYPLDKLDSIGMPGGFSGAMENWGAIVYTDTALLTPPTSTLADRKLVYSIQAHEMAHLWFGDLVTMAWWDYIWLNESFASWMAAKETDRRNPDWQWWLGQDDDKEAAMSADAVAGVHAIQAHVADEQLIDNAFDPVITYSKGQAILRMLEAWLAPDTFRDGVRRYIKERAYSNATGTDLWNALSAASGKDVGAVARAWTEQPGFPLVDVTARCDANGERTVSLGQHRYLSDGSVGERSSWPVPLLVRVGTAAAAPLLFQAPVEQLPAGRCDDALSLNADGIGYFRVNYDAITLSATTRKFATLPAGDRQVLLDDEWALVGAGRAPLASYLALVDELPKDASPRHWLQIAGALSSMEAAERGRPGHEAFVQYARTVLSPVLTHIGLEPRAGEVPDNVLLRETLYTSLGQWGEPAVVAAAQARFAQFKEDPSSLPPNEQAAVLAVVAHGADAGTFEALHSIARRGADTTERTRFYTALTQVSDPKLAARVIDIALSDEIPPEDITLTPSIVFGLTDWHAPLAWSAFRENSARILAGYTTFAPLAIALSVPPAFGLDVPLPELEGFVRSHVPASMGDVVDRGMADARQRLKRREYLVREMDAYLKTGFKS